MTENSLILAKRFTCNYCDYNCIKESDYNKHLLTRKHQRNSTSIHETHKTEYKCTCGKTYKFRQGLSLHKKNCTQILNEHPIISENKLDNNLIELLIKENTEFKNTVLELVKNISDVQKQMIDIYNNSKCL